MTVTLPNAFTLDRFESTRLPVRRFCIDEYHRMIEDGYFTHAERFELLEGWIFINASRMPPHDAHVGIARKSLARRLPECRPVRVRSAITLLDSEPEPDLAVVLGSEKRYRDHHPGPDEISLIVEVASLSLDEDRELKARVYARSQLQLHWIIDLVDRKIDVNWNPSGPAPMPKYLCRAELTIGSDVSLRLDDGSKIAIPVSELLPPMLDDRLSESARTTS